MAPPLASRTVPTIRPVSNCPKAVLRASVRKTATRELRDAEREPADIDVITKHLPRLGTAGTTTWCACEHGALCIEQCTPWQLTQCSKRSEAIGCLFGQAIQQAAAQ